MPVNEPGPIVTANRSTAASVVSPSAATSRSMGTSSLGVPALGLDAPVGDHLAARPERGGAGRRRRVEPE